MITIGDILKPEHIDLDLKMTNQQEAINHVAGFLREDERVTDWNAFYTGLASQQPCLAASGGTEICIPHTRTDNVTGMVMSAGRSASGILVPGEKWPIHFIFVIGVQVALAADYLRIIGAMTRIFRDPVLKEKLRAVPTREEFLQLLTTGEMKL